MQEHQTIDMNNTSSKIFAIFIVVITAVVISLNSCYYDNEYYLYSGGNQACDSVFTYSARIKAITDQNCAMSGCHTSANPAGSIPLTTYQEVRAGVEVAGMLCSIRHESGCSPMPKNRSQLSPCDIQAYEKWRDLGFPQ